MQSKNKSKNLSKSPVRGIAAQLREITLQFLQDLLYTVIDFGGNYGFVMFCHLSRASRCVQTVLPFDTAPVVPNGLLNRELPIATRV